MAGHDSMVTDDCTLLAAHRAGDPDAFGQLYDRHAPVVLSFCRRGPGGVGHDGEDAMQDTFIRAHARIDDVDDCRGFRKWLLAIASFVVRERRRSHARRSRHAQGAATEGRANAAVPESPAERAERRDALDRLSAALDLLPDDERLAIHLQYLDPDPVAAAASALGVSRSAYYRLLARGREHLAQLMSAPNAAEVTR